MRGHEHPSHNMAVDGCLCAISSGVSASGKITTAADVHHSLLNLRRSGSNRMRSIEPATDGRSTFRANEPSSECGRQAKPAMCIALLATVFRSAMGPNRRCILDPAVVESIIRRPLLTHYQLPLRQRQE